MNQDINQQLQAMADDIRTTMADMNRSSFVMIGIHTGGVWVAEKLRELIDPDLPLGTLDISFYRDDFTRIGINPEVKPSSLPFEIENAHILLVDDVLHTGRTIRAAMNELFDYGRPASISLAVLVRRKGQELPIHADFVGQHLDLPANQHIKLTGPDPLTLSVIKTE